MSFATIATIALVASASFVSAAPIVARSSAPSTYYEGYLEEYDVYHARYIALDCKDQHNTTFFDDCCHPLLANETVSADRPSYCSVNATVSSSVESSIAEYTSTATASASATADVEAEEEYSSASTSVEEAASTASYYLSTDTTATATATASVDNAENWAQAASSTSASSSSKKHHKASSTSTTEEAYATTTSSSEDKYTATSTSTSTTAASTTSSASSSSETMTGGYATYFYQDGVAGECGTVHSDSDYIIAIDANGWWSDYETNDDSPYCGKSITITNTNNGKSVTATVADVCPTCDTNNSLDLSVGAFTAIASESDGEVPITWVWA